MGLDTTHDCFHGSYTSFYVWRLALCKVAGIQFEATIRGRSLAEQNGDWDEPPEDILYVLMDHADAEGHILPQHCGPLADRLDGLLSQVSKPLLRMDREATVRFVLGLRDAAARGERVLFQ